MKKISLFLLAFMTATVGWGQDITGSWSGILKVQGIDLPLVFHIEKSDQGYSSTMDSPSQGAAGIPVNTTTFENSTLVIKMTQLGIEYTARLKDGVFQGTFKQGGLTAPLDLKQGIVESQPKKRPQDPVKPYPYYSEEVTIDNPGADVKLAGTFTRPTAEGKYPVAILITGSGPQNRDEELMGHKPFLILSDYLTRNGIAVLRYDDRGTAASTGNFRTATSADLATDAEAAIAYLKTRKDIDVTHIGLIGHSEGGIIGPMVAARSKDVAFVVMLAGTGMTGLELLPLQGELVAKAMGTSEADLKSSKEINAKAFAMVAKSDNEEKLRTDLRKYMEEVFSKIPKSQLPEGVKENDYIEQMVNQITSPWMRYFLNYDPVPALKKLKCPVLALNGDKDLQVPSKENLALIKKALKNNHDAKIVEFPGMNHLFQECTTGAPTEYAQIEETMSPKMLKVVGDWINGVVK